jgi:formylmethanofuran dehydrogenase subunit E
MKLTENIKTNLPQDLIKCIDFHGYLCPGLVYGYLVAKEAISLLELKRSNDEEIIAISENDSCAVDALQVLLGTTAGKGNLIFKNYGKNAYTIIRRSNKKMFRFCRKKHYYYDGKDKEKFVSLYAAINSGSASKEEQSRYKILKSLDLLSKSFNEVFSTKEVNLSIPSYAPIDRSEPCKICGELTMSTKLVKLENGQLVCIPCSNKNIAE